MNLKTGDLVEYTNPYSQDKQILKYTGTRREVKGVMFDFFINGKKETVFFSPEEVDRCMKQFKY